ncbi:MAG TPA: ATP-binding protein [Polyangiaceae bacterium]|nr:ATP-binding protein [Polyangiaceae bacterium]
MTAPSSNVERRPASCGETTSAFADPYVELNKRLTVVNGAGAAGITALTALAIRNDPHRLAFVVVTQVVVIAFNTWVNVVLLPRRGRRAEIPRTVVNLTTAMLVNHVAGWPIPVWAWLPYVALAFDHLDRKIAVWTLVLYCVVQDAAALLEGVPWIYPLSSTLFAIFCSEVSRLRYSAIRAMLVHADQQHRDIAEAHEFLGQTIVQLADETVAREQAERELMQAQKLEAVGRLAAGVAHEINTPVQFVNDSVQFLRDASNDLVEVIRALDAVRRAVLAGEEARPAALAAGERVDAVDLPYLEENVPPAFERALEGMQRLAKIVRSMKEFAYPDSTEMKPADLNRAIESTLVIARSEYKYVAELETEFGKLPHVTCHAGELNQVVLNLVVNAAHAIEEVVRGTDQRGRITVKTHREGDHALISIQDTGAGIPESVRPRIFEPFFTTKEVGRGTGQGLALARAVVEKHRGKLWFETEVGTGTTFFIRLPLDAEANPRVAA